MNNLPTKYTGPSAKAALTSPFVREDLGFRKVLLEVDPQSDEIRVDIRLAPPQDGTPRDVARGEKEWALRTTPLMPKEAANSSNATRT